MDQPLSVSPANHFLHFFFRDRFQKSTFHKGIRRRPISNAGIDRIVTVLDQSAAVTICQIWRILSPVDPVQHLIQRKYLIICRMLCIQTVDPVQICTKIPFVQSFLLFSGKPVISLHLICGKNIQPSVKRSGTKIFAIRRPVQHTSAKQFSDDRLCFLRVFRKIILGQHILQFTIAVASRFIQQKQDLLLLWCQNLIYDLHTGLRDFENTDQLFPSFIHTIFCLLLFQSVSSN